MPIDYGINNVNTSGIITATSGNFSVLNVNGTGVSISGHNHTSSSITDFNSSVSGLLTPYQLALTNPVTGVGTSGYLSKWISSSGVSSGIIYDNGTNIGIGTTSPSKKLDVIGDARISGVLNIVNISDSTDKSISVTSNNMTFGAVHGIFEYSIGLRGSRGSACGMESNATNGYLALAAGGSEKVRIATDGKVGVGITSPLDLIHVSGTSTGGQGITLENADGYGGSIQADNGQLYVNSNSATAFRVAGRKIRLGDGGVNACAIELSSVGSISQDGNGGGLTFSGTTAQFSNGINVTGSGTFTSIGAGTTTPSGQLHVIGTGIFDNSIRLGSPSSSGTIIGLSTSGTVPAIVFDTVGNNHGNQQAVYDFRENGVSLISIDGAGNLQANAGNIVGVATNPSADTGSFIGHGMRRRLTSAGMEFVWGESITSVSEPGIDLFPAGGTHISSGILFRLSKDSNKTDVAVIVDGSGRVGVGTSTPSGQLHVIGTGLFSNGIGINTTSPSGFFDIKGDMYVRSSGVSGGFGKIYFPATNFGTDNSIWMGLDSNQNLTLLGGGPTLTLSPNGGNVLLRSGSTNIEIGQSYNAGTNNQFIRFVPAGTEAVRITSSGNVGIGTTSPSSKLDINGNVNIDGNLTFDSFTESVISNGNSSSGVILSLTSGTVHTCTLTNNCTFTMPSATAGKSFTMFLNTGSGNYTAAFSGVRWADSATPTATILANKVDIYSFISDGTYWYGSFSQNYG